MVLGGSNLNQYLLLDKDLLERIYLFLKVFDEVIEQLSDDERPTIYKVLPLRRLLNECKIQDNDYISLQKLKQFLYKLYNFILVKFSLIVLQKIFNENRNINFVVNF